MKRQLLTTIVLGLFSSAPTLVPASAFAHNRGVENALANYSDVSVFYQALLNTGVLNELNENTHYTIFAPTNEAFAQIQPNVYPCFYSAQCRAQVADVLRNHIVVGDKTLKELTREVEVPTIGRNWVYAESPYVGQYTVANRDVMSGEELNGNMIYRMNGVILSNAQLAQFQTTPAAGTVRTVVTYHVPSNTYPIPGGDYEPAAVTETITKKTYVAPENYSDYDDDTTTVTHVVTPER